MLYHDVPGIVLADATTFRNTRKKCHGTMPSNLDANRTTTTDLSGISIQPGILVVQFTVLLQ